MYAPATCAGLPPKPIGPPLPAGRACSQSAVRNLPFCDTSLPRSTRVDDLVARFSLPELASQLQARSSAAVPRLGLGPFMFGNNNIHGLSGEHCHETGRCPVSFPDGIAMAASFNETAWRRMGAVAGREMRALYNVAAANSSNPGIGLTSWGPTCNLIRDGRWGRSQESASECPFHSGRYCAAISMGLQDGEDSRYLLVASGLKHFAAYSLEQYLNVERQTFNAAVTRFDATDSYFPAFRTAIVEGGAAGVMYAANEFQLWDPLVDPTPSPLSGGVPGCLSAYLSSVLTSWNFSGYRCTDGGQISQAVALHKFVPTLDQAIGLAAAALSDIADGDEYAAGGLVHAWLNGNISLSQARRLLADALDIRFRLGLFDPPHDQPYEKYGAADVGAPQSWESASLASRESLILLKNDAGVLPLRTAPAWARSGSLAVIGTHANDVLTLQGNYGGSFCPPGPHGPVTTCFPSIFESLLTHAPGAVFAQGSNIASGDSGLLTAAIAAAKAADAVVLVLGLDQSLEREQLDRVNMTLPSAQIDLFNAVKSVAKGPIIVVLVHGGALAIAEVKSGADAIIDALYPGVTGGTAVSDAIFGLFSPGGKLPYTVYDADYQYQYNFTNMSIAAPQSYLDQTTGQVRTSPGGRTYRYFKGEPLWSFGFGLSYANWTLAWATPPSNALSPSSPNLVFSIVLTNDGGPTAVADEVVQVYVEPLSLPPPRPLFVPIRSLSAFSRKSLASRASTDIAFNLTADAFMLTQADGTRAILNDANFTVRVTFGPTRTNDLTFTVRVSGF